MTDSFSAVQRSDELIGPLSERRDSPLLDPAVEALLAIAAYADAAPRPRLEEVRGRPVRRALRGRRRLGLAIGVALAFSSSGIAAAVTGDPLAPVTFVVKQLSELGQHHGNEDNISHVGENLSAHRPGRTICPPRCWTRSPPSEPTTPSVSTTGWSSRRSDRAVSTRSPPLGVRLQIPRSRPMSVRRHHSPRSDRTATSRPRTSRLSATNLPLRRLVQRRPRNRVEPPPSRAEPAEPRPAEAKAESAEPRPAEPPAEFAEPRPAEPQAESAEPRPAEPQAESVEPRPAEPQAESAEPRPAEPPAESRRAAPASRQSLSSRARRRPSSRVSPPSRARLSRRHSRPPNRVQPSLGEGGWPTGRRTAP